MPPKKEERKAGQPMADTSIEATKGKPPPRVKVPTIRRIKAILVK
jgi:hypothetical protein